MLENRVFQPLENTRLENVCFQDIQLNLLCG